MACWPRVPEGWFAWVRLCGLPGWRIYNESASVSSNTIPARGGEGRAGGWGFYVSIISLPEIGKVFYRKYHSVANTRAYGRTACGSEISSWKVLVIII